MALKKIGVLWKKEGKSGQYYTGKLDLGAMGEVPVAVFEQEKWEDDNGKPDNRPDFNICLLTNDEK